MNIQLNDLSETRKSLVVTLDQSEVAAEHQAVVAQFAREARLPGFRPGKAPAAMVAKRFAKEIAEELQQKVFAKAYKAGCEEKKLEVITVTNVDEATVSPDAPATVTITVDVRPEFALPDYIGLPTEIQSTDVTDAEIDQVIEGLRAERADFKQADRPAQKADYVKLSYEGKVDGQAIAEIAPDRQIYGKVPQTWEEVEGENEGVIPGLGKQLAGLKTGDKKDVTITFPADFAPVPALAGKTAIYSIEVLEIRERVLPALDEAFLKSIQAESIDALKTNVRGRLQQQKEMQNRAGQRNQVTDALASKVEIALPEALVESEAQNILARFMDENMRRGVKQEQFEKDKTQLVQGARKSAAQRVKVQLILGKIVEKEGIKLENSDIDAFIYREAMRTQQAPDKIVKELTKNRDALRNIQQSIVFDKAVDFLVSKATVTTVSAKS
ncbi:MAG: Trigger factor [Verrucomicrobia bacterium ADurb.Bin122]|nr:MAG: Trigger factor [Verrucomicrobia bacterium ADurb.Bin122]HOD46646.1 trigger factor [Opitutaceae bacterium]HOG93468.1 trigger factor [Opitutaceae bacterium]HQL21219.1 trigger factor [Opitutaceae bacterium]